MEKQKYVYAGLGVIVTKNNKILTGRRISTHEPDTWCFPGGYIEVGETWEECAIRETKEECGLEIQNIHFVTATNDIFSKEKHHITIFMQAECISGEPQTLEPDKIIDWQWVEWENLPKPLLQSDQNLIDQGYHPFK